MGATVHKLKKNVVTHTAQNKPVFPFTHIGGISVPLPFSPVESVKKKKIINLNLGDAITHVQHITVF